MTDSIYQKFVKRWEEVTDLPPQTLGPFTPVYKFVTRRLKVKPWPALIIIGLATVTIMYGLIGTATVVIASILQRGF